MLIDEFHLNTHRSEIICMHVCVHTHIYYGVVSSGREFSINKGMNKLWPNIQRYLMPPLRRIKN